MNAKTPVFELRFHHAMPGWCKIIGLQIKPVPECEGGGYKIPEAQARLIVAAVNSAAGIPVSALEAGVVGEMLEACKAFIDAARESNDEISLGMAGCLFRIRDAYAKAKGESP